MPELGAPVRLTWFTAVLRCGPMLKYAHTPHADDGGSADGPVHFLARLGEE